MDGRIFKSIGTYLGFYFRSSRSGQNHINSGANQTNGVGTHRLGVICAGRQR